MSRNKAQFVFALLNTLGFFAVLLIFLLISPSIPEPAQRTIDILVGALVGSYVTSMGWYFHTSQGSSEKNDLLQRALKRPQNGEEELPES